MAGLDAIHQVGESLVALLRARRNLLAASGGLGPVPPALDIQQASTGRLATPPAPTSGLTLTCWRVSPSETPPARPAARQSADRTTITLELSYLLVPWSSDPDEEQGVLGWAMLELARQATLDRSLLTGGAGVWARDEVIQISPENVGVEDLFRLWDAMRLGYRLSAGFRARVVRLGFAAEPDGPPVVASRFDLGDADPLTEGAS